MKKRILVILFTLILVLPIMILPVSAAQSTVFTYSLDRKGNLVRTQDAYLPDRTVTDLSLNNPEDLFFDTNGNLYIADTGNSRIVVYNPKTDEVINEIVSDEMMTPRGVYVTDDGFVYVADTGAAAVHKFSVDGELVRSFVKPTSPSFGDTVFSPYRVAVDLRGNIYIIGEGVYNGIIQLSVEGEFLGYFSSNKTTVSLLDKILDVFYTDAQKANLLDRVPMTFSNVFCDKNGIIYSTSMGSNDFGLKKHNMAGSNMFTDGVWSDKYLIDLYVGENGIIYAADASGYICVYSNDGNLIFMFGADKTPEDIAGMYSALASIAVSPTGEIWTLDSEKSFVQSYTPTEYTLSIYNSLALFDKGYYAESANSWNGVLRYNQMSVLAHRGLGKALLYTQQYEEAAEHFKLSGSRYYYSQAFWETRNTWLMDNLLWALLIIVAVVFLGVVYKYIDRKKVVKTFVTTQVQRVTKNPRLQNIFFAGHVARHPLDAYYYLKRKQKGSVPTAIFFFVLFFAAFMFFQTGKAFILQYTEVEDMDMGVVIGGFIGIVLLFIVSNYLVTSIKDGEGSLKDIFMLISYSSLPATVALTLFTILTHVVTFNEVFLLDLLVNIGLIWSVVLIYLGLQEMHNYNVKNNIVSLIITAAFMLIAIIILFNLMILGEQFIQFIESIVRELIANVQKTY